MIATVWPGVLPAAFRGGGTAPVYFEAAAVIVTLVLLGQVLELRARAQTSGAIRALLKLVRKLAHRVDPPDGQERDVGLDAVAVGDRLRVRPGENVPVDGVVLDGASHVDGVDAHGRAGARAQGEGLAARRPARRTAAGSLPVAGRARRRRR